MKITALLFVLTLFSSCSTLNKISQTIDSDPTKFDPDKIYRYDMLLTVNGVTYEGMGVLPNMDSFDATVWSRGPLDLFVLQTCARHWTKESAWDVPVEVRGFLGWGSRKIVDKRKISFTYRETDLERKMIECPMRLEGWDKYKGKHSFGWYDFEDDKDTLPAYISCNGETRKDKGVGWCQVKTGIPIAIQFEQVVNTYTKCIVDEVWEKINEDTYKHVGQRKEFKTPKGLCIFYSVDPLSKKSHRVTTHGYEVDPIRGD